MPNGYEPEATATAPARGLVVLLCGIPGCGKDAIGRACAHSLKGAALSQDEHNGHGISTQAAFDALLAEGLSPIFVLRNGVEVGDRLPYVLAARRAGYRVAAVWPQELSVPPRRQALLLASLAGCYGRLSSGGRSGHETLTITDGQLQKPAQVCLNFFHMFRAPSAPGEVDAVLQLPFLQSDLGALEDTMKVSDPKGKVLPTVVQDVFEGDFEKAKNKMMAWGAIRRPINEISDQLTEWVTQQMLQKPTAPAFSVESVDTKKLQRAAKIRAAVEHLVSPYNLLACRDGGTTVTSCKWLTINDRLCPAWPPSYFAGAPQLKKWQTTMEDVLAAARESLAAQAALQEGDKGARVQLVDHEGGTYVSPVDPLPEASLKKLRCPDLASFKK